MKIPTILGLFILFLISALLIYGSLLLRPNSSPKPLAIIPTNIEQNNNGSDTVTVTWETPVATTTEILVSKNSNMNPVFEDLKDNRDDNTAQKRITHISTLNDLTPNTAYFIKIKIGDSLYPAGDTQIKTTPNTTSSAFADYNPIVGSIIDQNLQPESDALVFLFVQNAYPLSTSVGKDGSFILPLTNLQNKEDSNKTIDPQMLTTASLFIIKGNQKSEFEIKLDKNIKPLPPIVLGQNLDLRLEASPSTELQN